MTQYIPKADVVAELEERKKRNLLNEGAFEEDTDILSFINSMEVKEVNLEGELNNWRHEHFRGKRDHDAAGEYLERSSQLDIAKYFFELGLKAQKGERV